MKYYSDDDFTLINNKKGGGSRKQTTQKNKERNDQTCYSSKHIRKMETILNKSKEKDK